MDLKNVESSPIPYHCFKNMLKYHLHTSIKILLYVMVISGQLKPLFQIMTKKKLKI